MALLPLLSLAHASVILKVSVVLSSLGSCLHASVRTLAYLAFVYRLPTIPWTRLLRCLQSLDPASASKEWRETWW